MNKIHGKVGIQIFIIFASFSPFDQLWCFVILNVAQSRATHQSSMHKNTTLNLTGIIFKAVCLKNSANLLTFSLKGLHHELTLVVSFYFLFFVRSHVRIYNSKYPCLDIRCLNSSCTTSNPATSAQFHTGILVQLVAVNANFCQSLMLRCSYTKDRKGA